MNADSVKSRLKNFAECTGLTYQEVLTYYALERILYRISISEYADKFVLKGGILLYAVFNQKFLRSTSDADLLARNISNISSEMETVFRNLLAIETDDAIVFDLESLKVKNITEFKKYHGLHVSATGYLDRSRIPVGIDIGFGDIIYPDPVEMDFPVILDMEIPTVKAYTIESVIAEKLEAIVHNGYFNSRYKDFYDIYILTGSLEFQAEEVTRAVTETFNNRKTLMTVNTAAFKDDFIQDPMHLTRWDAFLKQKRIKAPVFLEEAMLAVKSFAVPVLDSNLDPGAINDKRRTETSARPHF